jgi:hypothetical protein
MEIFKYEIVPLQCIIRWQMVIHVVSYTTLMYCRMATLWCNIHPEVAQYKAKFILPYTVKLFCVSYNAEWWLRGVTYNADLHSIRQNKLGAVSYINEWGLRDVRSYTAQLLFGDVRYTANWRQVYFVLFVLCNSQNKLGASWRCILHRRMVTPRCKILHCAVALRRCKIHCHLTSSLFCLICTVQLPK